MRLFECSLKRQVIALAAKAADNAFGDIREVRMVPKRFPLVHVRQMHLN
jgi:hypothetical protein